MITTSALELRDALHELGLPLIVRRGEDPPGAGFDIAAFTRDVLAALPAE